MCPWRRQRGPGSGFRGSCAGECLPVFGCFQSRKPLEARELTLESEIVPEHRVSLESNERKFLSLSLETLKVEPVSDASAEPMGGTHANREGSTLSGRRISRRKFPVEPCHRERAGRLLISVAAQAIGAERID